MTLPPLADTPQSATFYKHVSHVLELIATGADLREVLDALCRLIDDESGLVSSVYLLARDGTHLHWAAGPDVPEAWRDATRTFAALATNGACGAAVTRRTQVIVTDISLSPLFDAWRDAARVAHVAGAWST